MFPTVLIKQVWQHMTRNISQEKAGHLLWIQISKICVDPFLQRILAQSAWWLSTNFLMLVLNRAFPDITIFPPQEGLSEDYRSLRPWQGRPNDVSSSIGTGSFSIGHLLLNSTTKRVKLCYISYLNKTATDLIIALDVCAHEIPSLKPVVRTAHVTMSSCSGDLSISSLRLVAFKWK